MSIIPQLPPPFTNLTKHNSWKNVEVLPPGDLKKKKYDVEMNGPFLFFVETSFNKNNQIAFWIFTQMYSPQPDSVNCKKLLYIPLQNNNKERFELIFQTEAERDKAWNKLFETTLTNLELIKGIESNQIQKTEKCPAYILSTKTVHAAMLVLGFQNSKFVFQAHLQSPNGSFSSSFTHPFTSSSFISGVSKVPQPMGNTSLAPLLFMIGDTKPLSTSGAIFMCSSIQQAIGWVLDCYVWFIKASMSHTSVPQPVGTNQNSHKK